MTDAPKYPKPTDDEKAFLYDLAWDIRENGLGAVPLADDPEKYIAWLQRYEGFTDWELEVKEPLKYTQVIGYIRKD